MSEPDLPSGPESDELLAIERALGLLEPDERRAAERRAADDPAFAVLCDRWQVRALALLDGRDEAPSPQVWAAIVRRLPANEDGRTTRLWKAATAGAAALALGLGAVIAFRTAAPPPPPPVSPAPLRPLVAVLASAERPDVVAVSYDPIAGQISAQPSRLSTGGREAELWVIPAGGRPVPAGLLHAGARTALSPAPRVAALLVPGATLAVSLEPKGGSRTGAPTGPVILTGVIARS